MRYSILIIYCALVTAGAVPSPWDVIHINRHINTKTTNKNVDDNYSITLLKSGDEKYNIKDTKVTNQILSKDSSEKLTFDGIIQQINNFVGKIDELVKLDQNSSINITDAQSSKTYNEDKNITYQYVNNNEIGKDICEKLKNIKNDSMYIFVLNGHADEDCIRDIARVAKTGEGSVIVFGLNELDLNKHYLDLLLSHKQLIHDEFFVPSRNLILQFGHYKYRAYVGYNDLSMKLYKLVNDSDYFKAARFCKTIDDKHIKKAVDQLLKEGNENIVPFAYKIWDIYGKDIVLRNFPKSFGLILGGAKIKIQHIGKNGNLRLSSNFTDADRGLFADCSHYNTDDLLWKFVPVWKNNSVSFKIMNPYYNMYLKLQYNPDCYGDRIPWGATSEWFYQVRFRWNLVPVKSSIGEDIMYCIVNSEYGQSLTSSLCTGEDQEVIGTRSPCQSDLAWIVKETVFSEENYVNNPAETSFMEKITEVSTPTY